MNKTVFFTILLVFTTIVMSSCEKNDYADWKLLNEQWWENNKEALKNEGFQTTESGLMYKIIDPGEQRHPSYNSYILVTYTGSLIDGSTFDKSEKYPFSMNGMIKGWIEGLRKIQNGGIIQLYMPHTLGYGTAGSGSIPPYSVLKFEIQLLQSDY